MPLPFHFSSSRAARLVTSFANGGPIQISAQVYSRPWSQDELLQVAGAALFAAFDAGSAADPDETKYLEQQATETPEQIRRRRRLETLAAATMMRRWTRLVMDERFDENYEAEISAVAALDDVEAEGEQLWESVDQTGEDCHDDAGYGTVAFSEPIAAFSPTPATSAGSARFVTIVLRSGAKIVAVEKSRIRVE